jgi:hypothetical protein
MTDMDKVIEKLDAIMGQLEKMHTTMIQAQGGQGYTEHSHETKTDSGTTQIFYSYEDD